MQTHHTEIAGSSVIIFVGIGAFVHWLAAQEHWLASISYIMGTLAAAITIIFKIREAYKKK
jgi:hypothetical protein